MNEKAVNAVDLARAVDRLTPPQPVRAMRPNTAAPLHGLPNPVYCLALQRGLDVAAAVAGLLFLLLVLPALALIIKLDSPGPVFYNQDRVGHDRRRQRRRVVIDRRSSLTPGRPFKVWKLRTMVTDAERNGPQWAAKNDCRVTRIGRFLRKTRLDEVPQFWNVLRGEMSLVGPRPERLCFINQFEREVPRYRERLLVRPGITGLAQVENGYDTDLESVRRKVALDRRYVRDVGLGTDLKILAKTVKVVLKGSGAL